MNQYWGAQLTQNQVYAKECFGNSTYENTPHVDDHLEGKRSWNEEEYVTTSHLMVILDYAC